MRRLLMVATISRFLRDFLLPHANHFRAQGWQVDALANGIDLYPECLNAFDRLWEAQWSRNPLDPRNLVHMPAMIQQLVDNEQYDLVHVHTPVAAFVTRYALRHLQQRGVIKVIYTAHGFHFHPLGNPIKNGVFLGLEMVAGQWTDYLVVLNADDEAAAQRYRIVPAHRMQYMPGIGVDMRINDPLAVSAATVNAVRQELGLTPKDKLFLMVAEFNPGKHHHVALEGFVKMRQPNAHLAFAGDGPLRASLMQRANALRVADRVHFLGFRYDIPALMRTAVATILPSEREGLPRSIMESLCLQIPVIGTDIRGIRDLLCNKCGILVPHGDTTAVAQAMDWLLLHPDEAQRMGEAGRVFMQNYEVQRIIDLHEQLYHRAMTETVQLHEAA